MESSYIMGVTKLSPAGTVKVEIVQEKKNISNDYHRIMYCVLHVLKQKYVSFSSFRVVLTVQMETLYSGFQI